MVWHLLADLVVGLHLLWILFLILGALPGRRLPWVKVLHLAALAFSLALQLFGWICPLTRLEVWLRAQGDPASGYAGDFLAHYAESLVYLQLPPAVVLAATVVIASLSAWAYWPDTAPPGARAGARRS